MELGPHMPSFHNYCLFPPSFIPHNKSPKKKYLHWWGKRKKNLTSFPSTKVLPFSFYKENVIISDNPSFPLKNRHGNPLQYHIIMPYFLIPCNIKEWPPKGLIINSCKGYYWEDKAIKMDTIWSFFLLLFLIFNIHSCKKWKEPEEKHPKRRWWSDLIANTSINLVIVSQHQTPLCQFLGDTHDPLHAHKRR